jgi:hypothetical protein
MATESSAAQPAGRLALKSLSFAQPSVDASGGGATVALNWTVTDSNPSATSVSGVVTIRMAGPEPGSYIGQLLQASYFARFSGTGSGQAQQASYSYAFPVPQYANATTARWVVTKLTAQDDQGLVLTAAGSRLDQFDRTLTATELVDSTAPTYDALTFARPEQRPYLYDNGVSPSIVYFLDIQDIQSGFWRGRLELSGPQGQKAHADFNFAVSLTEGVPFCGGVLSLGGSDTFCFATVTLPAGAAAGTWTVSEIRLTDNAGNVGTFRNVNALPVIVTANAVMTASAFSASPNPLNNWGKFAPAELSMTVTGARQGISAIYVDGSLGNCVQRGPATVNPDGTASVPLTVVQNAAKCVITGIAVVDGAGDVALYGTEYNAPDPGVVIAQIPDTPPVITSASLSPATVSLSTSAQFINMTVNISNAVAPVNQIEAVLYDSSGNQVLDQSGAFSTVPDISNGPVTVNFEVAAGLQPGVYTVRLIIFDVGGLHSIYGAGPGGQEMPGGPLQLTVTAS